MSLKSRVTWPRHRKQVGAALSALSETLYWPTHLVVVHVAGGGAPGDRQVLGPRVSKRQVPHSSWD